MSSVLEQSSNLTILKTHCFTILTMGCYFKPTLLSLVVVVGILNVGLCAQNVIRHGSSYNILSAADPNVNNLIRLFKITLKGHSLINVFLYWLLTFLVVLDSNATYISTEARCLRWQSVYFRISWKRKPILGCYYLAKFSRFISYLPRKLNSRKLCPNLKIKQITNFGCMQNRQHWMKLLQLPYQMLQFHQRI